MLQAKTETAAAIAQKERQDARHRAVSMGTLALVVRGVRGLVVPANPARYFVVRTQSILSGPTFCKTGCT
jgi:hypothetical protein